MKREINILPADTFVVVNRTILNESDRKIIRDRTNLVLFFYVNL